MSCAWDREGESMMRGDVAGDLRVGFDCALGVVICALEDG